jgi:hypothetical protein
MKKIVSIITLALASINIANANRPATAPVSGFARSFILGTELSNATITILETGEKLTTDEHGHFGPFRYPIGKPITLQFEKFNYKTTQSGTFIVPKEGLTGDYNNITFQIPSIESFYLLKTIVGGKEHADDCHVTTTIIKYHKTMDDIPQGEEGAKLTLSPAVDETPFYFDIFKSGPLKDKTNPFSKGLTATSDDGGAAYFNLPASEEPYTLSAEKDGKKFTDVKFICHKGAFINISPPTGPMVATEF